MSPDRKPAKRASRAMPAGCAACGVTYPAPHKPDCTAVAAEREHAQAVREAWESGRKKPPAKPVPSAAHAAEVERLAAGVSEEERWQAGLEARLRTALAVSVPQCIARWRADPSWTHQRVISTAHACGELLCYPGGSDVLMYGAPGRPEKAQEAVDRAFEALTQGLAACSFTPGGVDFVGLHFESNPEWLKPEGA